MGKPPLRLVSTRRAVTFTPHSHVPYTVTYWIERLECGHELPAFCYVLPTAEPVAKRRRCQECKSLARAAHAEMESPCTPTYVQSANEPTIAKTLTATHSKPSANALTASAMANGTSVPPLKITQTGSNKIAASEMSAAMAGDASLPSPNPGPKKEPESEIEFIRRRA